MKTIFILTIILMLNSCTQEPEATKEPAPVQNQSSVEKPKACTKDAKMCPDGRTVGRNPAKNCEFDECETQPVKKEPLMCTADVKQCADGSYVGRDPYNNCKFKDCPSGDNGRNIK